VCFAPDQRTYPGVMYTFLVPSGTLMSSLKGGLRPPVQQPGLPAERGDQALDRFSEPARGIAEGELSPCFCSPSPEGKSERGRIASLMGGRAPDRDHEHRPVIHV